MSLKILNLNVELNKHNQRWLSFIKLQKPDVVCFQEALSGEIFMHARQLGYKCVVVPLSQIIAENKYNLPVIGPWGLALWVHSDCVLESWEIQTYSFKGLLPEFTTPNSGNRALLLATIQKADKTYRIITTHFTWTGDGKPDDEQRQDFLSMKKLLNSEKEFVLCGDFNAPRGTEIFDMLASEYKDNIPAEVKTTIDSSLHYSGGLELVVDGMFSTPAYTCTSCQVIPGLSDHCGVMAEFERS